MTPATYRTVRNAIGLSQLRLARALGVHPTTISKRERGVLTITQEAELAILSLLKEEK